ncbi:hypothetical protein MTR_6g034705 [Medicago truncatula]|uniref:Uncharacterized protein n=1 Tax=Medicago truncatula TaxID=3880 RepID=A0A072UJ36_MEDTR|nr:hypothetical protein MTR_6g034705 [Medicago truncatula]
MICVLGYDNGEGLSLWNLSPQSPSEEDRHTLKAAYFVAEQIWILVSEGPRDRKCK